MNKKKIDMVNGSLLINIVLFAIPVMLTGILQLLFNACDMVVVGRFAGSEALAAVGSTSSLTNLLVNTFLGLSVGANVITAHSLGAREYKETKVIVHTAITMSVACGVILAVLGLFLSKICLEAMGTPDDVINLSVLYMRVYFVGMPFTMLYNFGSAIMRAQGNTTKPLMYLSIAGVVNIVLNLILVIIFKLSVAGVAIATTASQAIAGMMIIRNLMKQEGPCHIDLRELRIDYRTFLRIVRIGLPAGINSMVFSFANVQIQSSINSFGSSAMAGSSAAASLEGFVYTSMNSIHQAALNFTGQNIGAGKKERIPKILINCLIVVTVIGLIMGFSMYGAGRKLLAFYTSNPSDIEYGMMRLKVVLLFYFSCGQMEAFVGVIRGLGYSLTPTIVSLIGACGLRIVWLATAFGMYHDMYVLFASYPVSWIVTTIAHMICYFIVMKKIKNN